MHWDANGVALPMIGSKGEGPGQFQAGPIAPFVTVGDTLYVRDNRQHWVVFGPDHAFLRFSPMGPISGSSIGDTQFADDGLVLSSANFGREHYSLLAVDRSGNVVHRIRPRPRLDDESDGTRAAVAADDGTYWVGPEIYSRGGYWVEQWDSTGRELRSLHRAVPWYVADSLLRPFKKNAMRSPTDGSAPPFLFPRVQQLVMGEGGRLWIVTQVPKTPGARDEMMKAANPFALYSIMARVLEKHVEVFDPASGSIVASSVFPSGFLLMPHAQTAVLVDEDSASGLRRALRLSMRLASADGAPCK